MADIEKIFGEEVRVGTVRKPRYHLFSVGVVIGLQMSIAVEQAVKKKTHLAVAIQEAKSFDCPIDGLVGDLVIHWQHGCPLCPLPTQATG